MNSHPAVLLVTDAVALPATAVLWALRVFEDKVDGGRRLAVITQASKLAGTLNFETASLDAVISLSEKIGFNSVPWLVDIARILKSGGIIVVQEPQTTDMQTKTAVDWNLLLAGYVNSQKLDTSEEVDITLSGDAPHHMMIKAQKPAWEIGSTFSIRKKTPVQQEPKSASSGAVLKLSSNEVYDMQMNENSVQLMSGFAEMKLPKFETDDDLVDEDSLLTEDDLKRPEIPKAIDCEVGKAGRKACKNCTCGRAEAEEKEKKALTVQQLNNPRSACGSCGLGDAFRCSGCPYKGLPPFNLGEKITLPGTLLTADV
eukprot:c29495_g1_i1 orf=371-1312(+)